MRYIRSFLGYLVALLLSLLFFLPVTVIAVIFRRDDFIYSAARVVIRAALRIFGVKTVVNGLESIDFSTSPVIICNHLSNLDGPLLISVLPVNPRVLIKAEARKIPLIGRSMKLAGFIFVNRSSAARRQEALVEAVEKIKKERHPFLIFPEGTRSRDGTTREFKKGGFVMALRAGVPVLPIRISGTRCLMPPGRKTCAAGRVAIDFFPPLNLSVTIENELPGIIRDLRQKIYVEEKA